MVFFSRMLQVWFASVPLCQTTVPEDGKILKYPHHPPKYQSSSTSLTSFTVLKTVFQPIVLMDG